MDALNIQNQVQEFFAKLGLEPTVVATHDTAAPHEYSYRVAVTLPDSGPLLIGDHGHALAEVQHLLRLFLRALNAQPRLDIFLDINDYWQSKEGYLRTLTAESVARCKTEHTPIVLPDLLPFERKLVHQYLHDYTGVEGVSSGDGKDRRLTIREVIPMDTPA